MNFVLGKYFPDWFAKVEIAFTRIPVFLVGIALADKVWEKQPVNVKEIVILVVLCICKGLMNAYHIKKRFSEILVRGLGDYYMFDTGGSV